MGVVSTPAAPLRTLRVAAAYLVRAWLGAGARESRSAARVRARGKVGLYFITGIKDPKRHARRAHARSHHLNTHTARLNEATEPTGEPDRLWSYLEETVLFADP